MQESKSDLRIKEKVFEKKREEDLDKFEKGEDIDDDVERQIEEKLK